MASKPTKTPENSEEKVDKKVVEIEKTDLEKLMKKVEDQSKIIDLLYKAADKGRLSKAMSDNNGNVIIRTAKVSKYKENDKLVVGWKLTSNISEIVNGRWVEDQRTLLMFEDGTTTEIPLLDFYRKIIGVEGEITSRTSKYDNEGNAEELLKITFPDGRVIEVSSKFVNQA